MKKIVKSNNKQKFGRKNKEIKKLRKREKDMKRREDIDDMEVETLQIFRSIH